MRRALPPESTRVKIPYLFGEVSIIGTAPVLKTGLATASAGSSPVLSAIFKENYMSNKNPIPIEKYTSTPEECFELILDLCADYDGYRDVKGLMLLIDEVIEIAHHGSKLCKHEKHIASKAKVFEN